MQEAEIIEIPNLKIKEYDNAILLKPVCGSCGFALESSIRIVSYYNYAQPNKYIAPCYEHVTAMDPEKCPMCGTIFSNVVMPARCKR